jgi:acyl-CoA dehydrogenase
LIGGKEGVGFKTIMKVLNKQRLHLSALCTGPAIRMLDLAIEHTQNRQQCGQPVGNFQLLQAMVADSQTEIYAAKCMVLDAARLRDAGQNVTTEASCAKMFATEMCGRVADRCLQIHGGAGYISEYSIERFYRDVRLFRLYEGTTQIQQIIIARELIKQATA